MAIETIPATRLKLCLSLSHESSKKGLNSLERGTRSRDMMSRNLGLFNGLVSIVPTTWLCGSLTRDLLRERT